MNHRTPSSPATPGRASTHARSPQRWTQGFDPSPAGPRPPAPKIPVRERSDRPGDASTWQGRLDSNSTADEETAPPAYLRRLTLPRNKLGWTAFGLFLGWVVVALILSERGLIDLWELEGREQRLRTELLELRDQAAQLDYELQEPGGMTIERPAREKFEMQRPGEIVYHFAPIEAAPAGSPAGGSADTPTSSTSSPSSTN